jgi:hypothetical protein
MKRKDINFSMRISLMYAFCLFTIILSGSCRKFLTVPGPINVVTGEGAFTNDNSASAVVTGNFLSMTTGRVYTGPVGVGYLSALYTDETQNLSAGAQINQAFYTDVITSAQAGQWTPLYQQLYGINAAIEGITGTKATLVYKNQWLGESYFSRALSYFYLVNLFGDVPLATTTSYPVNNQLARTPQAQVYQQMVADLQQAQGLLSTAYHDGYGQVTTDRARPNQLAATALLARVYLYTKDWANAEAQATTVISNTNYQLVPPSQTFLAASAESIWSLAPQQAFVNEFTAYNNNMPAVITPPKDPTSYGVSVAMNQPLISAFEPGDARFTNWVRSSTVTATTTAPATTYYFPNKYKSNVNGVEYIVMLRLAEQYLIRAEARAGQNNISGAQQDLNAVRARAGLPPTTATTQAALLTAIAKERQTELFTELGNRFFDLKRTGTINTVMSVVAPQKGGGIWTSNQQIWPIPQGDITVDPNLKQAPGYQ